MADTSAGAFWRPDEFTAFKSGSPLPSSIQCERRFGEVDVKDFQPFWNIYLYKTLEEVTSLSPFYVDDVQDTI